MSARCGGSRRRPRRPLRRSLQLPPDDGRPVNLGAPSRAARTSSALRARRASRCSSASSLATRSTRSDDLTTRDGSEGLTVFGADQAGAGGPPPTPARRRRPAPHASSSTPRRRRRCGRRTCRRRARRAARRLPVAERYAAERRRTRTASLAPLVRLARRTRAVRRGTGRREAVRQQPAAEDGGNGERRAIGLLLNAERTPTSPCRRSPPRAPPPPSSTRGRKHAQKPVVSLGQRAGEAPPPALTAFAEQRGRTGRTRSRRRPPRRRRRRRSTVDTLKAAFGEFDRNGDGVLSMLEVTCTQTAGCRRRCRCSASSPKPTTLRTLLQFAEFCALVAGLQRQSGVGAAGSGGASGAAGAAPSAAPSWASELLEAQRIFAMHDRDQSGYINTRSSSAR